MTLTAVGATAVLRRWPLAGGESSLVGSIEAPAFAVVNGGRLAYGKDRVVLSKWLRRWIEPPAVWVEQASVIAGAALSPDGQFLATSDRAGEIRAWETDAASSPPCVIRVEGTPGLLFSPDGAAPQ